MNGRYVKTECIVLKKRKYKESSALLDVFSPQFGRHTLYARGIYRQKRSYHSHLEPLSINSVEFFYKESRDINTVYKAELIHYPDKILSKLENFDYAVKIFRMLKKQMYPTESIEGIYRLTVETLERMDSFENQLKVYYDFMREYLSMEGLLGESYISESNEKLYCAGGRPLAEAVKRLEILAMKRGL